MGANRAEPLNGSPEVIVQGLLMSAKRGDGLTIAGVDYFPLNHSERVFIASLVRAAVLSAMGSVSDPDILHMVGHAAELADNIMMFDESSEAIRKGAPPA